MRDMRRFFCGVGCAAWLALGPTGAVAAKGWDAAGCATAAAVDHGRALFEDADRPSERGVFMKTVGIKQDAQHGLRWVVMADCEHPEWPARLVPMLNEGEVAVVAASSPAVVGLPSALVVRAGAAVRLWKRNDVVSMETTGIAEESGAVGKRIRVRLLRHEMGNGEAASYAWGVVRGVGELEIVP